MARKKCLRKIVDVWDDFVVCICPETRKLKAVARLSFLLGARFMLFDRVKPRAVRVILGVRAVADHKDLDIFKQAAAGPEGIPLISLDLVERFADCDAATLELDMHQWQAVDEDGHIIAVVVARAVCAAGIILVDDLQIVVVDVFLVDERDVFARAVIAL